MSPFMDDFSDEEEAKAEKRNKEYTDAEYDCIKDDDSLQRNAALDDVILNNDY